MALVVVGKIYRKDSVGDTACIDQQTVEDVEIWVPLLDAVHVRPLGLGKLGLDEGLHSCLVRKIKGRSSDECNKDIVGIDLGRGLHAQRIILYNRGSIITLPADRRLPMTSRTWSNIARNAARML